MSDAFGSRVRRNILYAIIIGYSILMVFQLFQMQILQHIIYDEKSQTNSIKGVEQDPPRGIFFDRNLDVLISNKPAFTVEVIPAEYNDSLTNMLEHIIETDSGHVQEILNKYRRFSKFHPRKIKRNASFNFVSWFEENQEKLPGIDYEVELQRDYSYGISGSHMFGYTKEISANLLDEYEEIYSMGDYIGHRGIEKTYEKYLRGKKGMNYFLVDSKQKVIGEYESGKKNILPVKGYDLWLTIDKPTQKKAEEIFTERKGSVIAIEPATGEILAYVSSPGYDLSQFASVTPDELWKNLQSDPAKPLFNRPIMSINPPGSTYKMMLATAALEEGVITDKTKIYCAGGYRFGNRFFRCHGGVHGNINVTTAIEESCNAFFYQLILKLGFEKWSEYSKMFGFGEKTGIDINGEYSGILPTNEYYDRIYGKGKWTDGYLLNLSIGQGELSVTPVQLAKYVSLIANNGKTKIPHFAKGYINNEKNEIVNFDFENVEVGISQKTFDIIKNGMYRVLYGEKGTAKWYKHPKYEIAGKTGTAQNPHGEDHALFVAFAPYDNPQIAVVVMVENVGFGSTHAAPVARDIIAAYLDNKNLPLLENNELKKTGL